METTAPVFEKIYLDYLRQVSLLALAPRAERLGIQVDGGRAMIPFLGQTFTVTPESIVDARGEKPYHAVCVVLCKYLLLCPETASSNHALVTYKDFKDAMPYVQGFRNTAEKPIARRFSGRVEMLSEKCAALGGRPFESAVACQLSYAFDALPKVPIYLLFNDADEDFPADCKLLFRESAAHYLDMECIAMIGMTLAAWLEKK